MEVLLSSVIASPMVQYRGPFVLGLPEEAWFDVNMMQKISCWPWKWDGSWMCPCLHGRDQ